MILVGSLRKQMPAMFGGDEKQKKLLGRLEREFEKCQLEYQLPRGDLPNVERCACAASGACCEHIQLLTLFSFSSRSSDRTILHGFDLNKFPKLERKNIDILDQVLSQSLPEISAFCGPSHPSRAV